MLVSPPIANDGWSATVVIASGVGHAEALLSLASAGGAPESAGLLGVLQAPRKSR